jgi:amphi-Trp domain-containing protein
MGKEGKMKGEVKIKRSMEAEALADVLDDLVKSFREGTVCVEQGGEFVTLKPGGRIEVEMEAGQKKGKQKLSVELSWRQVDVQEEEAADFKISSQEPEMTAPTPEEGEGAAPAE